MENDKPNINLLEHADQDNDLVNFLKNFRAYWDRYGQQVLWVILIVLLVIAAYKWWNIRQTAAHEDAWSSLATATSPEAYQNLARLVDRDSVRALALLRGADLLLSEAISPADPNADSEDPMNPANAGMGPEGSAIEGPGVATAESAQPVDPEQALSSAASMYQQVLDIPGIHKLFVINARTGLANVAESQGEWDKAKDNWQQVVDLAGEGYSMIRLQAKARLEAIDQLKQPVRFGESQQTGLEAGPSMPGGSAIPGMAPGGEYEFVPVPSEEPTPMPAEVPAVPAEVEAPGDADVPANAPAPAADDATDADDEPATQDPAPAE